MPFLRKFEFRMDGPSWVCAHCPSQPSRLYTADATGSLYCLDYYLQSLTLDENEASKRPLEPLWRLQVSGDVLYSLAVEPNTQKMMLGSGNSHTYLLDLTRGTRESVRVLTGHTHFVERLDCAPNNPNLAISGGRDGKIILWDFRLSDKEGHNRMTVHFRPSERVTGCQFLGGSSVIAHSGTNTNRIEMLDLRVAFKKDCEYKRPFKFKLARSLGHLSKISSLENTLSVLESDLRTVQARGCPTATFNALRRYQNVRETARNALLSEQKCSVLPGYFFLSFHGHSRSLFACTCGGEIIRFGLDDMHEAPPDCIVGSVGADRVSESM